ncbi:MAG: molybdopterin-dependent oxidoreductase, partial [Myxococcota bacterium]
GWDEALDAIADRIHAIQTAHGRDAVGLYLGNPNVHNLGMMTFGPMLWRTLGTRSRYSATSVDQLPHQLAASKMFGHQLLLPIPDVDHADLMVVIGANPLVSNGSLMSAPGMRRRLDALRARGGKLVVIDPRKTETAERADEHWFVRPGTDAAWLLAVVQVILSERPVELGPLADRIVGLDALRACAARFTPERVAPFTGIPADATRRLALALADTERAVVYARFGGSTVAFGGLVSWLVNAVNTITRHLDRVGGAMFTEPAFDPIRPPIGRGIGPGGFARWTSRVGHRPEFAGELPVAGLAEEILTPGDGQLRALIVWAGNPVLSTPNGVQLDRALAGLDLCVAVDWYVTETSRHAHYVLPPVGPLARPHYDVVFHALAVRNTARFADPVVAPDGDLRQDWEVALGLLDRIRRRRGITLRQRLEHRALRALGPVGIVDLGLRFGRHRLSIRRLRREPHGIDLGALRPCLRERMADGATIDLAPALYVADVERLDAALSGTPAPVVLIGRRQLHGNNSWLHNAPRVAKGARCTLLVHPADAAAHGLSDGGRAEVRSRVGAIEVDVELTDRMMPGVVSLPHGWGHDRPGTQRAVAGARPGASANDLTDEAVVDGLCGTAVLNGVPVALSPR